MIWKPAAIAGLALHAIAVAPALAPLTAAIRKRAAAELRP